MNVLVVYDSIYGNTARIAKVIAGAFHNGTRVVPVGSARASDLDKIDLLIIGSPTHNAKPTAAIQHFIDNIDPETLNRLAVAAFDTRIDAKFAKFFSFAANQIADGTKLVVPPEGFVVLGKEGPLKEGEIERAAAWARQLTSLKTPVA